MESKLFCSGGGCTAKLGPAILSRVLAQLPRPNDPALLIGTQSNDDGAVYQLTEDLAIVQTLDFFPPMIEDPYLFGQIAAANALSDIYAMGGRVCTALNIVCFPENMDLNILGKIMQGGSEKVIEGGGSLVGGHSITDHEVKYGLSVTGTINPSKIRANNSAQVGDCLILTKPLGTGLVCTAARMQAARQTDVDQAIQSMTTLNRYAAQIADDYSVHACTDITGFGLLGHLSEMLRPDISARIFVHQLPILQGAYQYAQDFYITAAGQRNRNFVQGKVKMNEIDFAYQEILFDPQTSGGLLFALAPEQADAFVKELQRLGLPCGQIGQILPRMQVEIIVEK